MKGTKPWHIAVIVAAVLAVSFMVYRTLNSDAPKLTSKITLVDLGSGELFEARTGKISAIIPEKNPDTGAFTLFPAVKDEHGVWHVATRYLQGMDPKTPTTALVSAKTGEVRVKSESVRTIKLGK